MTPWHLFIDIVAYGAAIFGGLFVVGILVGILRGI